MQPEVVPITDHLFQVVGRNGGRFPWSHAFLVQDTVNALIDTGCGLETLAWIKETYRIDLLINSHSHPDHTAGNWVFAGIPLWSPVQGAESHGRLLPLSRRYLGTGSLADRWCFWISSTMGFKDEAPTYFFDHGHLFDFGHLRLQAIHTPGHTCDHYCFVELESRTLLSFDIDLTPFGPWYGNRESSLTDFRKSLRMVERLGPQVLASSHREILRNGIAEALAKYVAVLDGRNDILLDLIDGGATKGKLIEALPIYGRYPYAPELLAVFEARMIDLHLDELSERNLIILDGDTYRRVRTD